MTIIPFISVVVSFHLQRIKSIQASLSRKGWIYYGVLNGLKTNEIAEETDLRLSF